MKWVGGKNKKEDGKINLANKTPRRAASHGPKPGNFPACTLPGKMQKIKIKINQYSLELSSRNMGST